MKRLVPTAAAALTAALISCSSPGGSANPKPHDPPPAESGPPQDLVRQSRLMDTLRSLPTSRAALGDAASRQGLHQTEALIVDSLKRMGYEPTIQSFEWSPPGAGQGGQPAPEHTYHNVIVDIPGRDLPNEVVLISAHFDAVVGAPGADDDGTGVAGLLEIARTLRNHPTRRTVRLAFFNLEECGLVGSSHCVIQLRDKWAKEQAAGAPIEKIVGMASLEMLGYFSDEPNSQKSPLPPVKDVFEPPTVGDSIAVVGIKRDQPFIHDLVTGMQSSAPALKITVVDFLPFPVPDMTRSDHRPFMIAGIPAVMVTDTANFRNPNYHKPTDTIATVDPKRFTLVVKAVAGATYRLAEPVTGQPQRP